MAVKKEAEKMAKKIFKAANQGSQKLNPMALGYAGGIVGIACALIALLFGYGGYNRGAAGMMVQWHMYSGPTLYWGITSVLISFIGGFALLYAIGWLYNKFA